MPSVPLPIQLLSPSTSADLNAIYINQPNDIATYSSNTTIATNLLTSLRHQSKINFNWSRQFNDTLITISNLLQKNFQSENHPNGGNVSEASASTATIGSNTNIETIVFPKKCQNNFGPNNNGNNNRRRHQNDRNYVDPKELDMLVMKSNQWDESDNSS